MKIVKFHLTFAKDCYCRLLKVEQEKASQQHSSYLMSKIDDHMHFQDRHKPKT